MCFTFSEFLKFKEEHGNDFFHIVQTPKLACEITLQVFTLLMFRMWNQAVLLVVNSCALHGIIYSSFLTKVLE